MNINEHILKLTGKVTLPKPLTLSKTYLIGVEGDVTESTDKDNNDGTFNREFKFEPLTVEVVNEKGDSIRAMGKTKMHQKIRGRHWVWQQENQSDVDYEQFGNLLIQKFDEVMEILR